MPKLTAMDEFFVHQIPEPLPNVVTWHDHWRESLFFICHHPTERRDALILTMAHYPKRETMDSIQMGRIGGEHFIGHHARGYDGDPHTFEVGPVKIDVIEPYEELHLQVDGSEAVIGMDLTFTARSAPNAYRRGTMKYRHEIVWDQSHMIQSGTFNGTYSKDGRTYEVENWWGQRDHSWGIRDHGRCPLWIWLAIQLPDAMLAVWHWEYPNGARVYTDGCYAPTDKSEPTPVIDFRHDLEWVDHDGKPTAYGTDADGVAGIRGHVEFVLEDGRTIGVDAEGIWARSYRPFAHGGLNEVSVRTDDGRTGTAIYEVTGSHHHRYFPDTVVEHLPPGP